MQDISNKFAPFIKEYVFTSGWTGLRPVQSEAAKVIFDTDENLLLSCGTSSGKTEAAFFPILTEISKNKKDGVAVLYIAPLKALINDQFERITYLCKRAGISVCHRHGDVSSKERRDLISTPSHILQITPESLEGLLISCTNDAKRIFGNLKYVVIDELHAFLGTDRGGQVMCQIGRIMQNAEVNPRIIGLSATIGDTAAVCELLSEINGKKTVCPKFENDSFSVSLLYEYFDSVEKRDSFVYDCVKKKNSLVFSNSREDTEKITASLRAIARERHDNGNIFIHHGSISASLRHDAEKALKGLSEHAVVCATSTLELGIDVGRLERVVTLGSPNTVSSFLQRLGRSGRRGNTPEMLLAFTDNAEKDSADVFDILPFELLQAIAIAELYRRERFVEPPIKKKYPLSLLCHQTLSVLASNIEGLSITQLARSVLTLPPFKGISADDYKAVLSRLYETGHIAKTDDGKVILGLSSEKLINSFRFYAVFKEEVSYTVKDESGKEIGEIPEAVGIGRRFSLAGRVWVCERLDSEARVIYARPVKGKMHTFRHGSTLSLDDRIAAYTAKILLEDEIYPYLGKNAAAELCRARDLVRKNKLLEYPIHHLFDDLWIILPWFGSKAMNTLLRYIRKTAGTSVGARVVIENPYVMSLRLDERDIDEFKEVLKENIYRNNKLNIMLIDESECYFLEKYDYLLPRELLRRAHAEDSMDIDEVYKFIKRL